MKIEVLAALKFLKNSSEELQRKLRQSFSKEITKDEAKKLLFMEPSVRIASFGSPVDVNYSLTENSNYEDM